MSSTILPFLYQTRTLQRASWRTFSTISVMRYAHANRPRSTRHDMSDSIPFEWDQEAPFPSDYSRTESDISSRSLRNEPSLTLSPREAHVFKSIFEEIAQGRMPPSPPPRPGGDKGYSQWTSDRLREHERMTEFRDKYLEKFPDSLRQAGKAALGMFDLRASDKAIEDMTEEEKQLWAERQRNQQVREDEKRRVEGLMRQCKTDFELWDVMGKEVFSLPDKLGIVPPRKHQRKHKKNKESADEKTMDGEQYTMEVHGPLFSHYLHYALNLMETSFTRPSPFAFEILPRVKSLGLTSYVLGATTPLYTSLARMYWESFADAQSVLGLVQEMNASGLHPDQELCDLLRSIGRQISGCTRGIQGPFVEAMANTASYDENVVDRLDDFERMMRFQVNRARE
ncbi:hypothetical protein GMORB2_2417 [Geosmithia morbida]|uniref:Mtf2-like C-terminal domain-containing protein n=1 Tax=Geosmithia morbida TaxID=1094350 RepID=A0A9P5D1X9_9HYPO|nr:uncharacterized protein GMORB2_2417 [Geosmithia morbida]KAF4120931.1 hypothetical protein GMORB2_2417 [Geosmithia morbida]